uniref:Uncharacterized protein n=1 Tax=Octopus bimaculoides TaxID=37653 RepID=A0A0L8GEG7_OCTBM
MRGDLILAFNIFNGNVNVPFAQFFTPAPDRGLRGHDCKLYPRHFRLSRRKAAFSVRIAEPWNKLPQDVIQLPSLPCSERLWTTVATMYIIIYNIN